MTTPQLEVDRIVENTDDGHTHHVQITLSPVQYRMLVGDIARRIHAIRGANSVAIWALIHRAGEPRSSVLREDALSDLLQILNLPAPSVLIEAGEEFEELMAALEEAGAEPALCGCGAAVERPGFTECGVCDERHDTRRAG
ncbi:hypothetical protein [Phycicoccus avicenniae]|uniref:hypothetical protein n=1 Tax=Phycicoccus avicenniae TaxID=2828860 RepID=UPI003D2C08E2